MSILSFEFLVFALLLVIAYFSLPLKWRPWVLLVFSIVFVYFGSAEPVNFIAIFAQQALPPLKILIPMTVLLLTALSFTLPLKKPHKWRAWVAAVSGAALAYFAGFSGGRFPFEFVIPLAVLLLIAVSYLISFKKPLKWRFWLAILSGYALVVCTGLPEERWPLEIVIPLAVLLVTALSYAIPLEKPHKWRGWLMAACGVALAYCTRYTGDRPSLYIVISRWVLLLTAVSYATKWEKPHTWRVYVLVISALALAVFSESKDVLLLLLLTMGAWGGAMLLQNMRQSQKGLAAGAPAMLGTGVADWANEKDWKNQVQAGNVMSENARDYSAARKWLLGVLLALDLGALYFVWKRFSEVTEWLKAGGLKENPLVLPAMKEYVVPLLLCYLILQTAGYLIDAYRGKARVPDDPVRTLLLVGRWRKWLLIAVCLILAAFTGSVSLVHLSVITIIVWAGAKALQFLRGGRADMEASARKLAKTGALEWADDQDWQKPVLIEKLLGWSAKNSALLSKCVLALVLVLDLGSMIFIKFYPTVVSWVNTLPNLKNPLPLWELIVPLGLSYFTFQSAGYLIDVYRGKADAPENPLRTLLFVGYFLQLPQGPISTWKDLEDKLFVGHRLDPVKLTSGFQLMMWGYFKKMVLADRLAPVMEEALKLRTSLTGWLALGAAVLYAIRLYADFSGGMDVVRGVSRMVGVELPENFRRPFFAKSVAEYWRRWHITLGTWFRTNLLYPLTTSKFGIETAKFYGKVLDLKWSSMTYVGPAAIALFVWLGFWRGFTGAAAVGLCFGALFTAVAILARRIPGAEEGLACIRPMMVIRVFLAILLCMWQNFSLVTVIGLIISVILLLSSLNNPQWGKKTSRAMPAALTTILVFFLIGIWHTFTLSAVIFGLYFGILMATSTLLDPLWKPFSKLKGVPKFFMDAFRMVRTWLLITLPQFFAFTDNVEKSTFMLERAFSPLTYYFNSITSLISSFFDALADLPAALLNPFSSSFGLDKIGLHFVSYLEVGRVFSRQSALMYWSFETFTDRCTSIMETINKTNPTLEWIIAGAALVIILVVDIICEKKNDFCDGVARTYFFIRWPLIILLIVSILVFGSYGSNIDSAAFLYTQF